MAHVADRPDVQILDNFIGGRWVKAQTTDFFDVHNPALGEVIGRTPLSSAADVDAAVQAASRAFPAWRETPVGSRAQVLFRFKALLEQHFQDLARTVTTEHGKTLDEARGSVRRGIECVEVACGASSLMQGSALEDIAAFRVPGDRLIKLHVGTWHAGPHFVHDECLFVNLENLDTNRRDFHAVPLPAECRYRL